MSPRGPIPERNSYVITEVVPRPDTKLCQLHTVRCVAYYFTDNVYQGVPVGRIKEESPAEIALC